MSESREPDLLEAARQMLRFMCATDECRTTDDSTSWHMLGQWLVHPDNCPACALRRAIASDEKRRADAPKCVECGGPIEPDDRRCRECRDVMINDDCAREQQRQEREDGP